MIYVISGPAGVGKGTLVAAALQRVPQAWLSVSATTRAPRAGEVDGQHYLFKSVDEFKAMIDADGFVEWACVHGNYYGTPKAAIDERLAVGVPVVLEIDVQGGFQVRELYPNDSTLVFIAPPSPEELEARLRGRGTEDEATIQKRLSNAVGELEASKCYDVRIVNDDVARATDELVEVLL